jgi:uncharacterized protein
MSEPLRLTILFLAGIGAGLFNALAGGGSIFTFPALIATGIPPILANVTNTVALCPGYVGGVVGQWRDLKGQSRNMLLLLPVAALGGAIGALLLTRTSPKAFDHLVPALVLAACALFAVQDRLRARLHRRDARIALGWAAGPVLLAAIYGGYFGAGLGVIVLAALAIVVGDTLVRLNALKQLISLAVNVTAAVVFLVIADLDPQTVAVMAAASLVGGVAGGAVAARVSAKLLRICVVTIGSAVALVYFVKLFRQF